jgi:hypothetical protein
MSGITRAAVLIALAVLAALTWYAGPMMGHDPRYEVVNRVLCPIVGCPR